MSELEQGQAEYLLKLVKVANDEKYRCFPSIGGKLEDEGIVYWHNEDRRFPSIGGKLEVPLKSIDGHEVFLLNITRGKNLHTKITYQTRARQIIVLARLDFGPDHRNPDGNIVGSPHLHVYREGYGDRWAYEINDELNRKIEFVMPVDVTDAKNWFDSFLDFCKINKRNIVEWPSGDML